MRALNWRLLPLSLSFTFMLAACEEANRPASQQENYGEDTSVVWPAVDTARFRDEAVEQKVDGLMARMTIEEKVGQIIQADSASVTPEEVKAYNLGSILSGGNSAPGNLPYATIDQWLAAADEYFLASIDDSDGGVAIPLIWGIDAVHGHNNVIGGTIFPHNIGLGAMNNPALMREIMRVTARELRATGHDWTFAPTLAVPRDIRWGRSYEGFGETPELPQKYAGPIVEGVQGAFFDDGFLSHDKVIASAKHFVADGGTANGVDQGDAQISALDLRDIHGLPYINAIDAGVQSVMASFSSWNGKKIHGHKYLLTDVLKGQIGFEGFVVGDWNAHGQVEGCTNTSCPRAINAGVDMFMAPDSWKGLYENTLSQVREGTIPMTRLDDAVRRILRVKVRAGIFETKKPSERLLAGDKSVLGSSSHREIARQAVRESLVLLKNNNRAVPIAPNQIVLVIGERANSVSSQSGGWTLTWQGGGLDNSLFPNAETILDGIKSTVEAAGGTTEYSLDGTYETKPDVAVVVFGEQPYAEFQGDIPSLVFEDQDVLTQLRRLQSEGIPTVSIFTSGRPLWLNPLLNASDAFVAAWWPGSEGGGIADVIFEQPDGNIAYDFKGKLSFSWPARPDQVSLNYGKLPYEPLFAYGYGLTYSDTNNVPILPEETGGVATVDNKYVYFTKGRAEAPWSIVALPASDGGQPPSTRAVDHRAQEDAIRITWQAPGSFAFQTDQPVSLTREMNGAMEFQFDYRVDTVPEGPVKLGVRCSAGDCSGELDFSAFLQGKSDGEWRVGRVSLSCFQRVGIDMDQITAPMVLTAEGTFEISISNAGLVEDADGLENCP